MFCFNCGKEIDDKAVFCVHCGASITNLQANSKGDPNEPANSGFVLLSVMFPMVGIILGAVESGNGKKRAGKAYLTAGIASAAFWVIFSVVLTLFCTLFPFLIAIIAGAAGSAEQSSHTASGCLNIFNNVYGGIL